MPALAAAGRRKHRAVFFLRIRKGDERLRTAFQKGMRSGSLRLQRPARFVRERLLIHREKNVPPV